MAKFDLVMDQSKRVACPSGRKYYFVAGYPLDILDDGDKEFLRGQPDFFLEVADQGKVPATPDKEEGSPPQSAPPPAPKKGKAAKPKKKKRTYDLDKLDADRVIEDELLAKNSDGPWNCPICGRKNIKTKSGLRAHVGSTKCVEAAREKLSE